MNGAEFVVVVVLAVGLPFSLFYGFKAAAIFRVDLSSQPRAVRFHQFWLNFLGSLLGWALLVLGLLRVVQTVSRGTDPIALWDAALLFAGFVGATGHLPMASVSLLQHLVRLVERHAQGNEPK